MELMKFKFTSKDIRRIVERESDQDISSSSRKRYLVDLRFMYFMLAKYYTKENLNSIGKTVARDHTTVVHGLKTGKNLLETDKIFKEKYLTLKEILESERYWCTSATLPIQPRYIHPGRFKNEKSIRETLRKGRFTAKRGYKVSISTVS